ncbi:hypothetical protein [Hydrogenophaga sp. IBVHS1]|uniref:hypothetical protein n=1 Tax=unclassified Hydrogenophaga TaxID=2610897 RepID=UPI0015C50BC8|nr:hypothetical protein [Hydrogenophaga sp. IBVHS1]
MKHKFSIDLEERRTTNQLRMAALDRRLQAHQEAFSLWRQLYLRMNTTTDDELHAFSELITTCEQWWNDNCLYLEPEARQAFSDTYYFASMYRTYLKMGKAELAQTNAEKVLNAGDVILKAVQLPGLSEREKKEMPKVDSGAKT